MPQSSRINELSALAAFRATRLCRSFQKESLGFVDVGARGGAHPLVDPIAELIHVIGFEPDEAAFEVLERQSRHSPFAKIEYSRFALAERSGMHPLYLCAAETNHSLRRPNDAFCRRYNMVKFASEGETAVNCETLDHLLLPRLAGEPHLAEFIKIDTQGTEHEILRGAEEVLRRQTVALFLEVSFSPIYGGQSQFSEVEIYLRQLGFTFYGFDEIHYRSRKALDKCHEAGRERLLFTDAIFFKHPGKSREEIGGGGRALNSLFLCTLVLGYYDFAIELLPLIATGEEERESLCAVAHHCARNHPSQTMHKLGELQERIHKNPAQANVLTGKFVDSRRGWPDYIEIALRPPVPVPETSPLSFILPQAISELPSFRQTSLFEKLRQQPLGCIDADASGEIRTRAQPMAELVAILAFEPDTQKAAHLRDEIKESFFQQVNLQTCVLAGEDGNRSFTPCRSLDSLLQGDLRHEVYWGEFMKIAAAGAEYDILNGGIHILRERTVALIIEVRFSQLDKKERGFSELELWLRSQGFTLYGFQHLHSCSQGHLDKKTEAGRERLYSADAIFFRDPFDEINCDQLAQRQISSLITSAILLRYYDFALELLTLWEGSESDRIRLRATIHQVAFLSPKQSADEVSRLHKIVTDHPDWANILVGKFVDGRRSFPDYQELVLS